MKNNIYPLVIACVSFGAGWFLSVNFPRADGKIEEQNAGVASTTSILSPRTKRSAETVHEHPGLPSEPLTERKAERLRFEKGRNDFIERAAAERAAVEEDEYRRLFKDLGLPDEKVKELLLELKEMKRTILVAEFTIRDSQKQKNLYLKKVEEAVGKEAYEEYKNYEMGKPAVREIAKFDKFIKESEMDVVLTVEEQSLLAELIKQTGAVTNLVDWQDPFSPTPAPASGHEAVAAFFAQAAKDIEMRSDELLMKIEERGGSQSMYDAVSGYYQAEIQNNLGAAERSAIPVEERPEIKAMLEMSF